MDVDFSKGIKYETFMIFIGLSVPILFCWMYFYHQQKLNQLLQIPGMSILSILILALYLFIFYLGVSIIASKHIIEDEIFRKKALLEIYNLDKEIEKLPIKYSGRYGHIIKKKKLFKLLKKETENNKENNL